MTAEFDPVNAARAWCGCIRPGFHCCQAEPASRPNPTARRGRILMGNEVAALFAAAIDNRLAVK